MTEKKTDVVSRLLEAGIHFGQRRSKWNPKMNPYIWGVRNGLHIIDIRETVKGLMRAKLYIQNTIASGKDVVFVGTKRQAQSAVQKYAGEAGMPWVTERWLGGTLTNFSTVKKSIKRLQSLEKEGSSLYEDLTKKELLKLNREKIKLSDQHRGIKDMKKLPDVIIVVDGKTESIAIEEARKLEIPIICIVDSNTDPTICDYPIPANDDSIRTIQLLIAEVVNTIVNTIDNKSKNDDSEKSEEPKEKKK